MRAWDGRGIALRTWTKAGLGVLLAAALLMIATPRLWVKNKRVQMTYDGRKSERVTLYHGSSDRLLFFLAEPGEPQGVYVFDHARGLWFCPPGDVRKIKILAFTLLHPSACADSEQGKVVAHQDRGEFDIRFTSVSGKPVDVTWQSPPR
ncbi:MAG: hypothetical protein HYX26_01300 [Acidobacteriales bacterium]|nr:hypothetical protein [Terriglobales bacterium]